MTQARVWVFYDSVAKLQSNPLTQDEAQSTILKIRAHDIHRFFIWTQGWQNWQPLKTYLESDQKIFVSTFTISRSNQEVIKAAAKEITEHTLTGTATYYPTDDDATFAGTHTGTHTNTQTNTNTAFSKIVLREDTMSGYLQRELQQQNQFVDFDSEQLKFSKVEKPKVDFSKMLAKEMGNRAFRHELKIEILLISNKGKTYRTNSKNISLSGVLLDTMMPFDFYDSVFDLVVISSLQQDPRKARVKLQAEAVLAGGQRTQRLQFVNMTSQQKTDLQNLLEDYLAQVRNKKINKKAG